MYAVQIDLKKIALRQRNLIMSVVKRSKSYYKLENQVLDVDFNTASKIFKSLEQLWIVLKLILKIL